MVIQLIIFGFLFPGSTISVPRVPIDKFEERSLKGDVIHHALDDDSVEEDMPLTEETFLELEAAILEDFKLENHLIAENGTELNYHGRQKRSLVSI